MLELKNYLLFFMEKYKFPQDSKETFLQVFESIFENQDAAKSFSDILNEYNQNINCDYQQMLENTTKIGDEFGIHQYTSSLLLFILLSKRLRENYAERGISEEIFFDSMNDLYYKLIECRTLHGIDGTYVAYWFWRFFNLTRFALGRLQFEVIKIYEEGTVNGTYFPKGSKAINVHIPRTGTKLSYEEVLNSYRLAAEVFADEFIEQPIVFCCDSWLLDPWLLTVLNPTSNIYSFSKDYKIVKTKECGAEYIARVVFEQNYTGNPADLSVKSSLHKAYSRRIENNEELNVAFGMFVYQNGKIINT